MAKEKKFHYAWIVLIGMAIIMGVARGGLNGAAGQFFNPVTNELGINVSSLTIYLSIASIVTMVFLPLAGKMIEKYDIRIVLIVGVVFQGGAFALYGLMSNVWGWYILSAPMAFGAIFLTTLAGPVLINRWFKKKNGLALGLMMAVVGLAGVFIQPLIGILIGAQGWRMGYIVTGLAAIVVIVPVALLMVRDNPEKKGLLPYGMEEAGEGKAIDEGEEDKSDKGISFAIAKKSLAFYSMLLFLFFMTAIASFSQYFAPYAESVGYSVEFAGQAVGAFMGGMFLGALIFGFLTDKIGARITGLISMGIGIVSLLILILVPGNPIIFSIGVLLFGFVASSVGTLGPLLTSEIFGSKDYGQIYATIGLGLAIAGIVAIPGYGLIMDLTGSYTGGLYAIIAMLIINMVLITAAFKGKKVLVDEGHYN